MATLGRPTEIENRQATKDLMLAAIGHGAAKRERIGDKGYPADDGTPVMPLKGERSVGAHGHPKMEVKCNKHRFNGKQRNKSESMFRHVLRISPVIKPDSARFALEAWMVMMPL